MFLIELIHSSIERKKYFDWSVHQRINLIVSHHLFAIDSLDIENYSLVGPEGEADGGSSFINFDPKVEEFKEQTKSLI